MAFCLRDSLVWRLVIFVRCLGGCEPCADLSFVMVFRDPIIMHSFSLARTDMLQNISSQTIVKDVVEQAAFYRINGLNWQM